MTTTDKAELLKRLKVARTHVWDKTRTESVGEYLCVVGRVVDALADIELTRLDALASAQPGDSADVAAARVRIDELEKALYTAIQQRDEAREDSEKRGEAMTRLSAALAHAEAERDGEREACESAKPLLDAAVAYASATKAREDGFVGHSAFRVGVAAHEASKDNLMRAASEYSRRRPATEGAKVPPFVNSIIESNRDEFPAAGDFERRVKATVQGLEGYLRGYAVDDLARRALRAEDDVRRLREAAAEADRLISALSAEPRK